MKQLVLPENPDSAGRLVLGGGLFHHLVHVRRETPGARFPAVGPDGRRYTARVETLGTDTLVLHLTPEGGPDSAGAPSQEPAIWLYQSLVKGSRLDTAVRMLAELGVSVLVPVLASRTVVPEAAGAGRRDRWQRIVREAAQQSGAAPLALAEPLRLAEVPSHFAADATSTGLFFHETRLAEAGLHGYLYPRLSRVAVVVGPEGGFTDQEVEALMASNFLPVHLPTTVLRAETAAVAAVVAILTVYRERETWKPN